MAEGGGDFGYEDESLDEKIDKDGWNDEWDDDDQDVINETLPFPTSSSTPYHGGEQHEMQTMQHEKSGLPDTSYEETPLLSGSIRDADIERRLAALRQDPRTGIINTTQMMDTSINPLSEEDRSKQIERVKKLIKKNYPNAKFDNLIITFSKKKPMNIVVLGPKGGENEVVLNDGSGLQKKILKLDLCQKSAWPPCSTNNHSNKR